MPTVQLKATKMSDAKVSFISLVERGANRIPFKIVKQEKGMAGNSAFAGLDLSNLFTRKSEDKPQAEKVEVVGVVTMKGDGFDSVKTQLEEQGIKVSDVKEMEDGSVVFKQVEGDLDGEGMVVRVNEHVALITKGFRPYLMDMSIGDKTFEDVCKSQGFYPGVSTVMNVLGSSVVSMVEKADDPSKAAASVSAMFDEARTYVTKMISSLPAVAFKSESIVPEVVEKAVKEMIKCKSCGTECEAGCEKCPKCGADPMAEPAKKEGEACAECGTLKSEQPATKEEGEDVCKACGSKKKKPADAMKDENDESAKKEEVAKSEKSLTTEEVSAIVSAQVGAAMDTLTKKMEEMISGLTSQVTKSVQEVSDKVAQVESVAKSASDKVAGIVVSGSDADDHDKVQKTERVGFGGREIDTAFMPRIRKTSR